MREDSNSGPVSNGRPGARGVVLKMLVLVGGAVLLKRFTKSTTRWDHARVVAQSLAGEKHSGEQAAKDPENYFNMSPKSFIYILEIIQKRMQTIHLDSDIRQLLKVESWKTEWLGLVAYIRVLKKKPARYCKLLSSSRWISCPAAELVDGSKILNFEKAFLRTPHKPFRQRFLMVKPCAKEKKCDVEVSTYAIRDAEEYKNFCDRPKDQRPQPEEVIGDIAEHLTTIYLKRCDRGKRCLYEGSSPADGFPSTWNGATYSTSELAVLKNNEIHALDRGYDYDGNQVWGVKGDPYEFKPASASRFDNIFLPLNFPSQPMDKRIEGSFVIQE